MQGNVDVEFNAIIDVFKPEYVIIAPHFQKLNICKRFSEFKTQNIIWFRSMLAANQAGIELTPVV